MVNSGDVKYPKDENEWRQWTRRWWEAMLQVPEQSNPISDPDGTRFKTFKQPADSENVWFLAGNLGNETTRQIDVKKGKAIFMPAVNFIACKNPGYGKSTLYFDSASLDIEQEAAKDIDQNKATVTYTGHVVQKMIERVQTPLWNVNFADPPVMGEKSGKADCLSDGIWIFTEPLVDVGATASIVIQTDPIKPDKDSHEFISKVIHNMNIVP